MIRLGLLRFVVLWFCPVILVGLVDQVWAQSCADVQTVTVDENQPTPSDLPIADERQIAADGHWSGLRPENYRINLTFANGTHYNGSVDIAMVVVLDTGRLMVNTHVQSPRIDYRAIGVRSADDQRPLPNGLCIKKITYVGYDRVLVLDLSAQLTKGQKIVLSFPSFDSFAYNPDTDQGAYGLKRSGMKEFSALNTIFQMRHARSVFPCVDHPSFKTTFDLCMEYPAEFTVAGNMPPKSKPSPTPSGQGRLRQCFDTTPVIPTYLFSFSLMKSYVSVEKGSNPILGLLVPQSKTAQLNWMLDNGRKVLDYMANITNFSLPLSRVNYLVVYPAPFWGVENFGLISADGGYMEFPDTSEAAWTILYHELVHHWMGDSVTISDWREICLQEGLTAFFEWVLQDKFRQKDLKQKAQSEAVTMKRSNYEAYTKRDYNYTQDIADHCFGRPPLIYYAVADVFGVETLERFLALLLKRHPMGTASLDVYDELMAQATGKPEEMRGYIKSWFGEPGPVILSVTGTGSELRVRQRSTTSATVARSVPLKVFHSSTASPVSVVLTKENSTVSAPNDAEWSLLDLDSTTLTLNVYERKLYRKLFDKNVADPHKHLSELRRKIFVNDFCLVLNSNLLPLSEEGQFDAEEWKKIFAAAGVYSPSCKCCLKPKPDSTDSCIFAWSGKCEKLRIVQMLFSNNTDTTGNSSTTATV